MPSYNLTLDDVSPLWQYKGRWKDQDKGDSEFNLYANATFHATQQNGASVSITFNGTGIYLYGAFRGNHDDYTVSIDKSATVRNGFHPEPVTAADFQLPLFGRNGLTPGLHEVILTDVSEDSSRPWLDLDFGVITVGDGREDTTYTDTILDDDAANITYNGDWEDSTITESQYYFRQTMHRVTGKGATATVSFYGNAVTVFGATSSDHGPYTVSLDDGPAQSFNGSTAYFHPQIQLYIASGLETTDHTLVITHDSDDPKIWFDLDYVVASAWATSNGTSTGSGIPASTTSSSSQHSTPVGAIAGGAAGGVAALALIGLLVFFFLRRRRRAREAPEFPQKSERDPSPFRHALPYPPGAGALGTPGNGGPAGGYGNAGLGAELGSGMRVGPGMQQRYGPGPQSEFPGSTLDSGSDAVGSTLGGTYAGNGIQRQSEPMMGHVDLPPPGYDQVLRNSPPAVPGVTSPQGVLTSSDGSVVSSDRGPLPSPVRQDMYGSNTGYVRPTKGAKASRQLSSAPI